MKKTFLIALMSLSIWGGGKYKPTYIFNIDLDDDNKSEMILFNEFSEGEGNNSKSYYGMRVYDDNDTLIWKSKHDSNESMPFNFKIDNGGCVDPLYVLPTIYKLKEDGKVYLVHHKYISENSKDLKIFEIYVWEDNRFKYLYKKSLIAKEGEVKDGMEFFWSDENKSNFKRAYINGLTQQTEALIEGDIVYPIDSKTIKNLYGNVEPFKGGMRLKKLAKFEGESDNNITMDDNSTSLIPNPTPEEIAKFPTKSYYYAKISEKDQYSLEGYKFRRLRDVLKQDRIYFYASLGDVLDTEDKHFHNIHKRNNITNMRISVVNKDITIDDLKFSILNESPYLRIFVDEKNNVLYVELLSL